jgi:hypothetical protein
MLFVIIYIIINWEIVSSGNYWSGKIVKPILISGILFLILHMILTWDDEQSIYQENELIIPKYKLNQGENRAQNEIIAANTANIEIPTPNINAPDTNIQLNNKYKVINKFDVPNNNYQNLLNQNNLSNGNIHNPTLEQFGKMGQNLNNTDNNINKLSNQNIFLSQKNSSKYGIKFI